MGFVKKAVNTITGGILGGKLMGGDKSSPAPVAASTSTAKSSSEIAADQEDEKRKRLLALNATGGNNGQLTPAGGVQGQATIGRKMLTGQ